MPKVRNFVCYTCGTHRVTDSSFVEQDKVPVCSDCRVTWESVNKAFRKSEIYFVD